MPELHSKTVRKPYIDVRDDQLKPLFPIPVNMLRLAAHEHENNLVLKWKSETMAVMKKKKQLYNI